MRHVLALAAAGAVCLSLVPRAARAHCDTLDGPVVKDARAALETGSVEPLAKLLTAEVEKGLRHRFAEAAEAREHAAESVERGRQYVAAYVQLMHYAERLLQDATTAASHGESAPHAH
jgi:hypothetical protein